MPKFYSVLILFLMVPLFLWAQTENAKSSKNPGKIPVIKHKLLPNSGQSLNSILFEDFNGDDTPAGLASRGWVFIDNDGADINTTTTFNGSPGVFSAYEGPDSGYVGENYQGAVGGGYLIDQWLITPEFTVSAGNVLSFYWFSKGTYDDSVYLKISDGGSTIPDFTENLGRYKVPETGWEKFTYTFTTSGTKRFALQYYHTDGGPSGDYSNYWGLDYFQVTAGPGPATNPSPSNGELINDINPTLSWTNPGGTTDIEVFLGTSLSTLNTVYSGTVMSSYDASFLDYSTNYYWKVNTIDANDTTLGDIWSFTTGLNPATDTLFTDDFESGFTNWTASNPNDACDWGYATGDVPGSVWGAPDLPVTASGNYAFASSDACGGVENVTLMGNFSLDLSNYQSVWIEFDSDFEVYSPGAPADTARVDVSVDGGLTWTGICLWQDDEPALHMVQDMTSLGASKSDVRFRLVYYGDYQWHWAVDNFSVYGIPSSSGVMSIAQAIEDLDMDYVPDRKGDTVTVAGVIISPNFQTSNNSFYLWDGTAGTDIFNLFSVTHRKFTWALGDSLVITGKVDQYNGVTEIVPLDSASWDSVGTGGIVPDPIVLTLAEYKANPEMYEGSLVGFAGLTKASGTWPSTGGSIYLSDGIDTVQFYIDSDTDIGGQTEPTWPQDVIGIGGQYDTSPPFDSGYEIFPRYYTDFLPAGTIPVELTSFNAKASGNAVDLSWTTATETNNQGFEIERKTADNFVTIGYVDGYGTSTEMHSYSFTDNKVESGTYYYRLKQIDFDGSYEYSNVVEVKVVNPVKFSLDQNYPNPFNPSTMITLNLATDSKVKLVIFDILGQEVKTLVNNNLAAGTHQFEFNAANLNSGVYFYRVDATGIDGTNFSSVKKMILTK